MQIEIRSRITQDIKAIHDKYVIREIEGFIEDASRNNIDALKERYDFKPLKHDSAFYRLRIDSYRLGCRYDASKDTLIIMRLLHRSEIYKFFP